MIEQDQNLVSTAVIHQVIQSFLEGRLQAKLEKLKEEDEGRSQLISDFMPVNWLPEAARRAAQIQAVSHAAKFTHPSADGSSLLSTGNEHSVGYVGTHCLNGNLEVDVVGNAAALDVYKFLRQTVPKADGSEMSLLSLAQDKDPAFLRALSSDPARAESMLERFAALAEPKSQACAGKLAKQLYWQLSPGTYQLICPLFSSSLAHAVHKRVQESRFSPASREARAARRDGKFYPTGYCDYPEMVIQTFGGSKPQNISQLNSERRGENYLFASYPPNWTSHDLHLPLNTETVFHDRRYFGGRSMVRRIGRELRQFLRQVDRQENRLALRQARARWISQWVDEVLCMAAEYQTRTPGWTQHPDCRLNEFETCWLDPHWASKSTELAAVYARGDWRDEVARRFGQWVNQTLSSDKVPFGDVEAQVWQRQLRRELALLRMELSDD